MPHGLLHCFPGEWLSATLTKQKQTRMLNRRRQPLSLCNVSLAHQGSRASVLSPDLLNRRSSLDQTERGCVCDFLRMNRRAAAVQEPGLNLEAHRDDLKSYSTCREQMFDFWDLIMDWVEWSFLPPSCTTGSSWPSVPEELNDALALTTALGYGLFGCEACRLNYCFIPVSMISKPMMLAAAQTNNVHRLKLIQSDDVSLMRLLFNHIDFSAFISEKVHLCFSNIFSEP